MAGSSINTSIRGKENSNGNMNAVIKLRCNELPLLKNRRLYALGMWISINLNEVLIGR